MGSLEGAPVVELIDAFDPDDYVGPPPGATPPRSGARSVQNRTTTTPIGATRLQSTQPPSRRPQYEPSRSTSYNVVSSSSSSMNTEAIAYTPAPPSEITAAQRRKTPARRGTRRIPEIDNPGQSTSAIRDSALSLAPPRIRVPPPTSLVATSAFTSYLQQQAPINNTTQPSILRQPPGQRPTLNSIVSGLQANHQNPSVSTSRFGAASFTTYRNDTNPPSGWNQQYLNVLQQNQSNPQVPLPAHSQQSTSFVPPVLPPSMGRVIMPSQGTSKTSGSRPRPPIQTAGNSLGDLVSRAMPIRSAYDDFMRHVQMAIPGVDVNELIRQISDNPTSPIQLQVPNGLNTASLQRELQKSLEQTMLMAFQSPGSMPINNNMTQAGFNLQPPLTNNQQAIPPPKPLPPSEDEMAKQDLDADANQDEEYHEVETYADYAPAKLSIGKPHPDPIVETSSLSTVQPPDINYKLSLPSKVIDGGLLSSLQLESVIYACQQHTTFLPDKVTRKGFLIGDGAGVGKGRTIAGIIYENHLCGRKKSIWLSVSGDLKLDAERDLKDIGANKIPVFHLGKFQYGRRINIEHGVVFTTYSGLVSKSQSIRGSLGTRIGQLIAWAGSNFDGVIVFDECHKAKNISMSKTKKTHSKAAEFALEIQNKLPGARVVYASATGASETKHLGYMTRLGIWGKGTPYETFSEFCGAIEKRGVGAMELVAVDLKMRGSYIARQLSFKTTSFEIRTAYLDDKFIELYDQCVDMWARALAIFEEAASLFVGDRKRSRTIWTSFWAAHQKFFKYLCIGAKVPLVIQIAQEALEQYKCVVIGLQSTGEAKTIEALDDGDINEFISTARATFESLVENHFPAPKSKSPSTSTSKSSGSSSTSPIDENWHNHESFKFLADDKNGVAKALLEEEKAATELRRISKSKNEANSLSSCRRNLRNQKVLDELAAEKRVERKSKSSRTLRAKRRAQAKTTRKSRLKKIEDSSDTEISNPLSISSEEQKSGTSTSKTDEDDSDDSLESNDYSDEEEETTETSDTNGTLIDSELNDNDVPVSAKRRRGIRKLAKNSASKRNALESDSDSDVQITAVKPKRNYEVIILSSDEEDEMPLDKSDPMVKHADRLTKMKRELLNMLESVAPNLPNNTLDDLIDRLGGPSKVAEMTGRKGRVVKDEHGKISYRNRNETDALENLNIVEKERFMNGDKYIAIISEAASSGISLQADRRIKNQRRRVHITIELPWSADRAIQQFGRTHRSNQTSGPEYVFVISELAGEKRFASIVAKRLESLGALTHGDRRATTDARDLSQFNIAGRYCKSALDLLCRYLELGTPFANIKPDYNGNFIVDAQNAFVGAGLASRTHYSFSPEPQASQVNHFLNRLLGMKVGIQNALFKLFTDYMDRLISRKKVAGLYDAGILELNSESGKTRCDDPEQYFLKTQGGVVKCTLHYVQVERGITWEEALNILNASIPDSRSGFHISTNSLTKASMVYMLVREPDTVDLFRAYKPNTGRAAKANLYSILAATSKKGTLEAAEKIWRYVYHATDSKCVHLCFFNSCKRIEAKLKCDVGLRHRNFCLLSGGILTAWPYLESRVPDATSKLQIVRLKLDSSNRVIGPIIPQDYVDHVRRILQEGENGIQFKRTNKVHIDLPNRKNE